MTPAQPPIETATTARASRTFATMLALAVASAPAAAQAPRAPPTPAWDDCGPAPYALCVDGPWFDFAKIDGRIDIATRSTRFTLQLYQDQDLRATLDETDGSMRRKAEILTLRNRHLAVKRDGPAVGDEAELINGPLLATKLAVSLLQLAVPKGAKDVTATRTIRIDEPKRGLRTESPSATNFYAPPWSASGTVSKRAPGEYPFKLRLVYKVPDFTAGKSRPEDAPPVEITGTLYFPAKRDRLPDLFNFSGYVIENFDQPLEGYKTLGDARRALKLAPPLPPKKS